MEGRVRNTGKILGLSLSGVLAILVISSCAPPPGVFVTAPATPAVSYSGYILVANTALRSVVMYDSNFTEATARVLKQYPASNLPASLAYYDSENVLVAVDGTPDRVDKINLTTGEVATGFILDSTNLTGVIKGIARLSGGDVLVSDAVSGAHMERFSVSGSAFVRYSVGWPATLLNTTQMIFPLGSNAFVACAAGTSDVVRTYSNVGAQTASASATSPVPSLGAAHDVTGCVANGSGQIAVAFSGATDTVRLYNSALSATVWSFSNLAVLPAPVSLGVRPGGNFLAVDANNGVVEIDGASGAFVRTFSPQLISTAAQILVIP